MVRANLLRRPNASPKLPATMRESWIQAGSFFKGPGLPASATCCFTGCAALGPHRCNSLEWEDCGNAQIHLGQLMVLSSCALLHLPQDWQHCMRHLVHAEQHGVNGAHALLMWDKGRARGEKGNKSKPGGSPAAPAEVHRWSTSTIAAQSLRWRMTRPMHWLTAFMHRSSKYSLPAVCAASGPDASPAAHSL